MTGREFIQRIPKDDLAKFNLHTKTKTIFPAGKDLKSNFRFDMQGLAQGNTCFNLQVQINKTGQNPNWRKASMGVNTTIATCIANPNATVVEVRKALLDSLAAGGTVKTAGKVPV
ncbi:hypothetical protein BGZ58_009468 [Dissophora ornata]|nr:hypothetical protein BGZ58_009468 [Dissophora ornata]